MTAAEFLHSFRCFAARYGTTIFSSVGQCPLPTVQDCEFVSKSCQEEHSHSNCWYFILLQEWDCVKICHRILTLDGRVLRKTGWPSQEEHAQGDWPFLAWLQTAFHYMLGEIQAVINSWPLLYFKLGRNHACSHSQPLRRRHQFYRVVCNNRWRRTGSRFQAHW